MSKYKHILLAVDFTEGGGIVMAKAAELVKQMKADFSIVHIVEPLPGYGYAFVGSAEIEMQLLEEAKKKIKEVGEELSVTDEKLHVEMGPTKEEIAIVASAIGADLIVVGSHGRHGITHLLGSTANAVIHSAKCDVLTVRIQEKGIVCKLY